MDFSICTVVGCHPSTPQKAKILENCLRSLQLSKTYTIVCSHAIPLAETVRDLCDIFFYEKSNEYVTKEELVNLLTPYSAHFFYKFDSHIYRSQLNLFQTEGSHHYAAFRNMLNGARIAKAQGFNNVIFTEGDNVFDERDFQYMISRTKGCIREGKKALFFRGHPTGVNAYSVLVCYFDVDFFLENFGWVQSKSQWLQLAEKNGGDITVEKIITQVLESCKNLVKEVPVDSPLDDRLSQHFPLSQTNVIDASFGDQREIPIANFCSEWSPLFSADKLFWFVTQCTGAKRVTSRVFLLDHLIFEKSLDLTNEVAITPVNLKYEYGKTVRLENVWEFDDGSFETRSFSLSPQAFKKYLQLNTVQFDFVLH